MAIDFDSVLATLQPPKNNERQPLEVSRDKLVRYANWMSSKGYKHTRTSLEALHAYLQGYGVGLSGDMGTGKTMFFKCLGVPILRMIDFAGMKIEDVRAELRNYYDQPICLDDIGREPKGNDYTVPFEPLAICLEDRIYRNKPTYVTMNVDEAAFLKRYVDKRLLDRMYELCKFFKFKGESQRHAVPHALDI